ncbi:MAG: alpha-galactosidase [Clostridia bacterium]|nr:alpha-galactosidase [Clostridia bacterium]
MKLRFPDRIFLTHGDGAQKRESELPVKEHMSLEDVRVTISDTGECLTVAMEAQSTPVRGLRLQWTLREGEQRSPEESVRVLGDAWERAYGDLGWKEIRPERCMPWYCAVSGGSDAAASTKGRRTETFGVKVRPAALCLWQYSGDALTLWLDTRCGGEGVLLGGRSLTLAEIIFGDYSDMTAYAAVCDFCGKMCTDPLRGGEDIWGSNNWYYAYGRSSHEEILRDTALVCELTEGCTRAPYMVIDDGWQINSVNAPWIANERFPDMKRLASEMREMGVHPGIWIRYLIDSTHAVNLPKECRRGENGNFFDPSHPAVLDYVRRCTEMIVGWGYELIKHDFSTNDIFGVWGFQAPTLLGADGWHFYDRTKTTAEIIIRLYQVILESAGETKILGCNCIGHLCAGLVHANRTGDDTSGMEWERTRKMGINTLAFRLPQQGTFFGADADCVGIKGMIPWSSNRQWLNLLARSASPLFVSCDPNVVTVEQKADLKAAYTLWNACMDRGSSYALRPVDWMETSTPRTYAWIEDGQERRVTYSWLPEDGASPIQL